MDGMQRKHRCGEPGGGQPEQDQDSPQQDRIGGVQEDVVEVVAEGLQLPERILDPETRIHEWVVLRGRTGLEPERIQAIEGAQRHVLGDVRIVVPDEARLGRGKIGGQRDPQQDECGGCPAQSQASPSPSPRCAAFADLRRCTARFFTRFRPARPGRRASSCASATASSRLATSPSR